ncbi:MAG: hypothetical protein JXB26_01410 [Candidatus Aminicenantes bacterium]|nr:hypothetical protein [Candidatus Aminicenantes bacterium]
MSDEKKKGRRPDTRFWMYAENWLFGSTRSELTNEERGIFVDFLSLASMQGGCIEVFSRGQLAAQLLISLELLDRCIDKFIKTEKIKRSYKKREKKEIFCIKKWELFQPEYLWKNPSKSTRKHSNGKGQKNDAHVDNIREERKEEKNTKKENGEVDPIPVPSVDNSPLHPPSKTKQRFLLSLSEFNGYPFNHEEDSKLFDFSYEKFPNIDLIKQTEKKIEWWRTNPGVLKNNPRKQLFNFFEKEYEFQTKGKFNNYSDDGEEYANKLEADML